MKEISIREFQHNASKYIGELPVTLTRYDKPIALVIPYANTVSKAVPTIQTKEIPSQAG